MNNLTKAQESLYLWLSSFERRSYDTIRQSCDYLNIQYGLGIESYAVWKIFYPLVYSGVVDHIGNGYFALSEPLAIDMGSHYVLVNCLGERFESQRIQVGLSFAGKNNSAVPPNIFRFHAVKVLSSFPTVQSIVDNFYESIVDDSELEYHSLKFRCGVAELKNGGLKRYFSIPKKGYQRQIPDKSVNPDALNISYYLERIVNEQYNGRYNVESKDLYLKAFGLPIMIHRVLLLDCLSRKVVPDTSGKEYRYSGIQKKIVQQLNRIFNNSIRIDE